MTTPTETPPSDPIRDAFEAMLWFLECVLGTIRTSRLEKLTPAKEIGALAACEVETDFTPDSPPNDLERLRDLIHRAAEEHARRTTIEGCDVCGRTPTTAGIETTGEERHTCAEHTDEPPLTEADLRAAEGRCELATPGPWAHLIRREKGQNPTDDDAAHVVRAEDGPITECLTGHNAAFIAAARTDLPRALREIRRLRATTAEQGHRITAAAKHLGCEPDVIVSCAETRMAEIERLRSLLSEARRRIAPLPRALTPEDHEDDTLPARIGAALGGKDH